jgi:TatD DNase family protein
MLDEAEADAALDRARGESVRGFVVPATKLDDAEPAIAVANRHGDVWAAVGFHPHEAKDFDDAALSQTERLAVDPRVVAIGEIGLDYHYDLSPRDVQRRVFAQHLELARRLGKPVIVHNRESTDDMLEMLLGPDATGLRGVLHSFTEDVGVARKLLARDYFISFSGIVTFKTAEKLREVAREIPLDRMLIETDTPYLAPVPYRGRENQPAYVGRIAELIAAERKISVEEVAAATTANFETLFGVRIAG